MKKILGMIFILLFLAFSVGAQGAVWYVKTTGTDTADCSGGNSWGAAFATVQKALECAQSGDKIWVAEGVYYPPDNNGFQLKENVSLYGGFAGNETSREQRNWVEHKTILSGDIDHNDIDNDGDGIIEPSDGDSIQGDNAGPVLVGADSLLDGFVITAGHSSKGGGGLYISDADQEVDNCIFIGNYASNEGGGIYIRDCDWNWYSYGCNGQEGVSTSVISNSKFIDNSAGIQAGAIYIDSNGITTVEDCLFRRNSAEGGGAVLINDGYTIIKNTEFVGNSAEQSYGGAIANYSGDGFRIVNCSFTNNSASWYGGAIEIMMERDETNFISNCIFWHDIQQFGGEIEIDNGSLEVDHSDVKGCGGSDNWSQSCGIDAGGNIDEDPLFVDPENGDLHLQASSPCIDAGSNNASELPQTDFEGDPRIINGSNGPSSIVDMGVDEYRPETLVSYSLDVTLTGEGTGSVVSTPEGINCGSDCSEEYSDGTVVNLYAMPDKGYVFKGWTGDCSQCGYDASCSITMYEDTSCAAEFGPPNVLYVMPKGTGTCTSWDDACSLNDALSKARPKIDEIWVAEGVYYPPNGDGFQLKPDVAVYGGFAGNETSREQRNWVEHKTILSGDIDHNDIDNDGDGIIEPSDGDSIQGDNAWHVLKGADDSTVDGFVVTAGDAPDLWGIEGGGGMFIDEDANHQIITNCSFIGNVAYGYGGAILNKSASTSILGSEFKDNTVTATSIGEYYGYGGGAIYNSNQWGSPIIKYCTFTGNSGPAGGAVYNRYADSVIINCTFKENSAFYGGAIYNYHNWTSKTTASLFQANSAIIFGGAIYDNSSSPTITDSIFIGNTIAYSEGRAAAIYDEYSYPTITNCSFSGHSKAPLSGYENTPRVSNSILWDNVDGSEIVYVASDESYEGDGPIVTYSDVKNGYPGEGNINSNPMFVDPDSGDLHLTVGSPCIDAGDNNADSLPDTDFEGDPRIIDGDGDSMAVVDMGADEYRQSVQSFTLTVERAGNGEGLVTSDPQGISCGDDCSETYEEGTEVTLSATPSDGYEFIGWTGDCEDCGSNSTCIITMDSDKTCSAEFEPMLEPPVIINFSAEPTEGMAPLTVNFICSAYDPDGGVIESIEWYFDAGEWPDYVTFDDNFTTTHTYTEPGVYTAHCRVWDDDEQSTESDNITITVTAPPINYELDVSVNPEVGGSVTGEGIECPGDCSENYEEGTSVTLTATPSEGYMFTGWIGDCSICEGPECTILMDSDKTCEAEFQEIPNEPPVIDSFTADPTSGDAPLTVTFTCTAHDPDGAISEYCFDFDGDGAFDQCDYSTNTATYTYEAPGTYEPTCKVVDDDGAEAVSEPLTVTVNEAAPTWVDITEALNITHSRWQLYDRIHRAFFILVTIENPGDAISGPIRMIITNPSIPVKTGVGVGLDPDGYTDDGDPYFIIVPEGETLGAGEVLQNLRINFQLQRKRLTYGIRIEQLQEVEPQ